MSDLSTFVRMSLSDSVLREEEHRTRERLQLGEGARNGPEAPEDPPGAFWETRGPRSCLPEDSQCQKSRNSWAGGQGACPSGPSGMEETSAPEHRDKPDL